MIKGLLFQQQEEVVQAMEENLSNLTSASGEASACSANRADQIPANYSGQYFSAPKKKRNLPGNPDPDAEVIALSPKALLATNRFVCEICNKGFQRDQNLQLHRRGHNLPWKLKQRANKEVIRKKVYVCPEASCVHHDPSRALGDLTGIKKHFCRKHGEKKWKCDKCSKRYAVQSDWKAHSKTCGTREYRCDCGTLFSRRDSFITHRAFCDALAEESAKAITSSTNPIPMANQNPPPVTSPIISHLNFQNHPHFTTPLDDHIHSSFSLKKEQIHHDHQIQNSNNNNNNNFIPPWLLSQPLDQNSNIIHVGPTSTSLHILPSPHMSATALLQKAAQMGAAAAADSTITSSNFGLHLSSSSSSAARDSHHHQIMAAGAEFPHALPPYRNNFEEAGSCFEDAFGAILGHNINNNNQKKDGIIFNDTISRGTAEEGNLSTRDFLGLRAISHSEFLNNIAAYSNCMNVAQSSTSQSPIQKPWQG